MLKLLAYTGGGAMVDALTSGISTLPPPRDSTGLAAWLNSMLQLQASVKGAVALTQFPATARHLAQLLKLGVRQAGDDIGQTNALVLLYEESVKAALGEIPWSIGLRNEHTIFEKKFEGAAEPRGYERAMIANGIDPPDLVRYYSEHPEHRAHPELWEDAGKSTEPRS